MKKPHLIEFGPRPKPLRHTVKTSDSFPVFFSECSSHWCQVIMHPSSARLQGTLKGDCWAIEPEPDKPEPRSACVAHQSPRDNLIATIHLCREDLACSDICHETLHAAWHRTKLLGIKDDDNFQEFVAYGQASLLTQIADWLNENP